MLCHVIAGALSVEVESNKRWFPDHTGKWSEDVNRTNQNLQDPGNALSRYKPITFQNSTPLLPRLNFSFKSDHRRHPSRIIIHQLGWLDCTLRSIIGKRHASTIKLSVTPSHGSVTQSVAITS